MLVKALKSFPYSPDGIKVRQVDAGEEFDCRGELVPGLKKAGNIGHLKAAVSVDLQTGAPVPLPTGDKTANAGAESGQEGDGGSEGGEGIGNADGSASGGDTASLEAVHTGGRYYAIKRGDETVLSGITKDEAGAFNEMDETAKAEFIAARAD